MENFANRFYLIINRHSCRVQGTIQNLVQSTDKTPTDIKTLDKSFTNFLLKNGPEQTPLEKAKEQITSPCPSLQLLLTLIASTEASEKPEACMSLQKVSHLRLSTSQILWQGQAACRGLILRDLSSSA